MYFGVDYYPEQWVFPYGGTAENPEAQWEQDAELMVRAGVNVVRMGDFTWGLCEPEDGKFNFDWLKRVMDVLGQAITIELEKFEAAITNMRNAQAQGATGMEAALAEADELFAGRFDAVPQTCKVRRLSDVISEQKINRIDLLKIDVQRAERDVLRGIEDDDWEKIEQIVMEVHDWNGQGSRGPLDEIIDTLESRGFFVTADQDEMLRETDRYNIYARRQPESKAVEIIETNSAVQPTEREPEPALLTQKELRQYLQNQLPPYMMPSLFVFLDALPRTPNGKLDRTSLPMPERSAWLTDGPFFPARTPQEELLADIWAEVLNVGRVGVHDNFFELGGHSLLATQLMSRVRKVFGVELSVRRLFEAPTVAQLCWSINQQRLHEQQLIPTSRQRRPSATILRSATSVVHRPDESGQSAIQHSFGLRTPRKT